MTLTLKNLEKAYKKVQKLTYCKKHKMDKKIRLVAQYYCEACELEKSQTTIRSDSGLPKNRKGTTVNIYKGGEKE